MKKLKLQKLCDPTYIHSGVCDPAGICTRSVRLQSLYSSPSLHSLPEVEKQKHAAAAYGVKTKTHRLFSPPFPPITFVAQIVKHLVEENNFSTLFPLSPLRHLPSPITSPHHCAL